MEKFKLNLQFFGATATDDEKRLLDIKIKREELRTKIDKATSLEEVRSLGLQLEKLNIEQKELEERNEEFHHEYEERRMPQGQLNPIATYGIGYSSGNSQQVNQREEIDAKEMEQRASKFLDGKAVELRSISITGGNVPLAGHVSNHLNPTFNEVSSIVDLVKSFELPGGESYKSPFVISSGTADYTGESEDYHDNDELETDFSTMTKSKITTYFELPEEVKRLGGAYFMDFVQQAARTAIRKKLAQQILIGTGGTERLVGIVNAETNVIPADSDLEISEITTTTLDEIIFSYGGDLSVEGGAYLICNKQTMAEFAKLRSTDGKRIYNIELDQNGNTGKISSENSFSVPFIITDVFKSFRNTNVGDYFAVYGKPQAYEMPIFSGLEVEESRHVKFKSGQIAVKASILAGGNVASYKGFTRIKKVIEA